MPEVGQTTERKDGTNWIFGENRRWSKVQLDTSSMNPMSMDELSPKQIHVLKLRRKNKLRKRFDGLDKSADMYSIADKFDKESKPLHIVDDSADDIYITSVR